MQSVKHYNCFADYCQEALSTDKKYRLPVPKEYKDSETPTQKQKRIQLIELRNRFLSEGSKREKLTKTNKDAAVATSKIINRDCTEEPKLLKYPEIEYTKRLECCWSHIPDNFVTIKNGRRSVKQSEVVCRPKHEREHQRSTNLTTTTTTPVAAASTATANTLTPRARTRVSRSSTTTATECSTTTTTPAAAASTATANILTPRASTRVTRSTTRTATESTTTTASTTPPNKLINFKPRLLGSTTKKKGYITTNEHLVYDCNASVINTSNLIITSDNSNGSNSDSSDSISDSSDSNSSDSDQTKKLNRKVKNLNSKRDEVIKQNK